MTPEGDREEYGLHVYLRDFDHHTWVTADVMLDKGAVLCDGGEEGLEG